jgi:hypothetical protein
MSRRRLGLAKRDTENERIETFSRSLPRRSRIATSSRLNTPEPRRDCHQVSPRWAASAQIKNKEGMMKVDPWFSVLSFAAASCLAAPTHEGSAPKDDQQGHEQGTSSDEPELSFVDGLTCSNHAECGRRSYCQHPTGQCSGTGTCQTRPKLCTYIEAPVCGCDGNTFPNACSAANARMSLEHEGACKVGEPCGKIVCEKGFECCNASCGTCVPSGGVCTQEACE